MYQNQDAQKKDISNYFINDKCVQEGYQTMQIVPGELWAIENFLEPETCKSLITMLEQEGFKDAPLTVGIGVGIMNKSVRDCTRVMIDDFVSANLLYEKLKPVVALCYEGAIFTHINERFRFLKYTSQQKFVQHYDGRYPASDRCVSMATMHFYLNTVEDGGETTFFDTYGKIPQSYLNDKGEFRFKSEVGKAAFFRQAGWLHEGSKVNKGVKYSVRNDLLYSWLTNDEIAALPAQKCGLCDQNIKVLNLKSCEHKLLRCGCPPFYNSSQTYKRCALCHLVVELEEEKCVIQ